MRLKALRSTLPVLDTLHGTPRERKAWEQANDQRKLTGRPWRRLREQILKRDCYLCQCDACKATGALVEAQEVDHITPLANGGSDLPSNLRAINRDHHKLKTQRESHPAGHGRG